MRGIEWRALRGSIVFLVIAAGVGAAVAGGAIRLHDAALRDYEREKGRLETIRSRYRTIDTQRRLVETWLPAFRALQAAGVVGEERRLAWIEALRDVAARVGLPSLQYRIEPRTAYEAAAWETAAHEEAAHEAGDVPGIDVHRPFSTVVRLEAGLLHEGDFVRLVRELAARNAGLYRIERCEVRRAGPTFVMRAGAVNLTAKCDLRWITLARTEAQR